MTYYQLWFVVEGIAVQVLHTLEDMYHYFSIGALTLPTNRHDADDVYQ